MMFCNSKNEHLKGDFQVGFKVVRKHLNTMGKVDEVMNFPINHPYKLTMSHPPSPLLGLFHRRKKPRKGMMYLIIIQH